MDTANVNWRKSTKSGGNGGECVEVAGTTNRILVRDTKDHGAGTVLRFSQSQWKHFTQVIR